jgi:GTP cyclohydrolase I
MGYGLPSKQTVNGVGGRLQARNVKVGSRLWSLDGPRTVQTTVVEVTAVTAREVVDVVTDRVRFTVAAKQELYTTDGWVPAVDTAGSVLAWTHARKLRRERLTITPGYEFGYLIGATCSDGTVGKNCVSLVVNDRGFAERYARCLTASTGLDTRLEPITRPSGYLQRPAPGFRVRVVSSYLADVMRQYVGGDAHHMRQKFPRVVLHDRETFDGFLDGYVDGDGYRLKHRDARVVYSGNVPFLRELAAAIGARFTPNSTPGRASHMYIADRWARRGTFQPECHPLEPEETTEVEVRDVCLRRAEGSKPFTLYSYRLDPHPGFLVNGHLARQPW